MTRRAEDEEECCRDLQRRADRVSSLIVASDYPAVDVAIEIRKLKEFAEEHFPDRRELFRRVYESRFRRLWQQFRPAAGKDLPPI